VDAVVVAVAQGLLADVDHFVGHGLRELAGGFDEPGGHGQFARGVAFRRAVPMAPAFRVTMTRKRIRSGCGSPQRRNGRVVSRIAVRALPPCPA
jgi:hypothetical protein